MNRPQVSSAADARADLGPARSKPAQREGVHALPFHELSPDEFEVFCYLLLLREHPGDDVRYYGQTGDGGRDVVHRTRVGTGPHVRLIQCKRYGANVTRDAVLAEMAKVWVNVFDGTIPERPDELVFYAVPDLTNPAKDLLDSQHLWRKDAPDALRAHLKVGRLPNGLGRHASEWWPKPTVHGALSLTERARKYPELVEEFFAVRKVIDGSVQDVARAVSERLLPALDSRLAQQPIIATPRPAPCESDLAITELKPRFESASSGLLRWPTTVGDDRWLERPELDRLRACVTAEPHSVSVVLGPPGSGKSALLARLGQQLVAAGVTVLAVKADQLRHSTDTPAKMAERLGLPVLPDRAVLAAAAAGRVVVLLDQLDALAELADLRSERLHLLLDLIDRLAGRANVHLVCSCREFEYDHDGRLGRIGASEVRLALPPWERVSPLLAERGIAADGWPDDARELLRVPYNLDVFLKRVGGPGEDMLFTSLQQLFNDLWQRRVVAGSPDRAGLLFELAEHLSESEELWTDRGRFDDRWADVEALIGADVLALSPDEFRVGFRHQSLFEFTRARAFARDGASLSDHVLARQDALFVRPTLWMALGYLRRSAPRVYAREFDKLWNCPTLRRHVRHLLIDFLSQVEQPPPEDWEQTRLIGALRDPIWRRKVLTAVTGRRPWFDVLAGTHLPAEMRRPPEESWDVVWVLVPALGFARERCLRLIEEHWLSDGAKGAHAWRVLSHLGDWDERSTAMLCRVVRGTEVERGVMWHVAQQIARCQPPLAVQLLVAWLDAADARRAREPEADRPYSGGVLDGHTGWHDIDKLAGSAPAEFVTALWPVVSRIEERSRNDPPEHAVRYADAGLPFARVDRREYVAYDSPDFFFLALDAAVRAFAAAEPARFWAFADAVGNPDSGLVQRVVCRGVREAANADPVRALAFLLADPRRFWLGGLHDEQCDSVELLQALAPHLDDAAVASLVAAVRGWAVFRGRGMWAGADESARGRRFRLLAALPPERLDAESQKFVEAEREALPEHVRVPRHRHGTGLREIVSPVSHVEMAGRGDDDILALFAELPDATETHHPSDRMVGGSVQASREFAEFAKANPARAVGIIPRFRPEGQQRPAAAGLRGLVDAGRPVEEVGPLVECLDKAGFTGGEFREDVACALGNLARARGLPDDLCALLECWRTSDWPSRAQASERAEPYDPDQPASILWQPGGFATSPPGRFAVLSALTRGYLCRTPPAVDRWMAMLEDHVERADLPANWHTMSLYLCNVRWADRGRAAAFLTRLYELYPSVAGGHTGIRLLAEIGDLLPEAVRRRAFVQVHEWNGHTGRQAFGELVGLRHLIHPEDEWARGQVEAALAALGASDHVAVPIGLAFAAANTWHEPECRGRATAILGRLMPVANAGVSRAALGAFTARDGFVVDDYALDLLRVVAGAPEVLVRSDAGDEFFDRLLDVFATDPDLVCRLCEAAVRLRGGDLRSAGSGFSMASSPILDVALRLQRSGGAFRVRGLELFEALLDLGVFEAVALARNNDLRLTDGRRPVWSRRRGLTRRAV